jgi:hypothetical protein
MPPQAPDAPHSPTALPGPAPSGPAPSGPARAAARAAALTVAAVLLGCTAVALLSAALLLPEAWGRPEADFPRASLLARAWVHWDAGWYAQIAHGGYWFRAGEQSPVAYFPAYPLAVGALSRLGADRFHAGIGLTLACGAAGLLLFHRWALQLARAPADAQRALLLLCLYPFAYYLAGAMYSDALFLLAVVGAFLLLERGHPGWAALLGAVATAARPVAPAVVLGLLVRQVELRRASGEPLRLADGLPALAGAGLALYMLYLGWAFGDPLAFAHVQSAPGWGQAPGPASWLKLPLLRELWADPRPGLLLRSGLHAGVTFGLLALVPATWRRVGRGYAVYLAVCVGLPALSTKDFMGLGRYALAAFPAFLTLALLLRGRPRLTRAWLAASALLLAGFTAGFAADKYLS